MTTITVTVSDKARLALKTPPEAVGAALLLAAAELAGIPKPLFLSKLAEFGVGAFDLTEEELRREQALD
jgi:hypothetical protein